MISQEKMIFRKIKSKSSQNRKTKIDVENRVAERTWWTVTYVVEPLGGGNQVWEAGQCQVSGPSD